MGALYAHISTIERARIEALSGEGVSGREIARRLGRSPNTVALELGRCAGGYDAGAAGEHAAYVRARDGASRRILGREHEAFLARELSPVVTVRSLLGRLALERRARLLPASAATCYRLVRGRPQLRALLPHRVRRARGTAGNDARTRTFQEARHVSERPEGALMRSEAGHRELDLVCGPRSGTGRALLVSADRSTRHYAAAPLPWGKDADGVEAAVGPLHAGLLTLTVCSDRGREFARWEAFSSALGAGFYVARPHAPWEKPTVEWGNGLLRRFFPKGTDFGTVDPHRLALAVSAMNHAPRRCLGWLTPHEAQSGTRVSYFK